MDEEYQKWYKSFSGNTWTKMSSLLIDVANGDYSEIGELTPEVKSLLASMSDASQTIAEELGYDDQ